MEAHIKTYFVLGIRKSEGNIQTECWISIEPITDTAKRRNNMSPSFTNVVAHIPIYCHQGNQQGMKLKNVLARVQDVLLRNHEQDFVSMKGPRLKAR